MLTERPRWPAIVLAAVCLALALQWLPEAFRPLFEYRRDAVLQGELWRLASASWLHVNTVHLVVNLVALALLVIGFGFRDGPALLWRLLVWGALVQLASLAFEPSVQWARGLSGVLHALAAYAAIRLCWGALRVAWLVGLALKLSFEAWGLPGLPGLEAIQGWSYTAAWDWLGVPVLTGQHLAGALVGVGWALAEWTLVRWLNRD